MKTNFEERILQMTKAHQQLIQEPNQKLATENGIYHRYQNPVLTAQHIPLNWRFDFSPLTNPFLIERFGVNAVLNAGAIKFEGKYILMARVEGNDRKSFLPLLKVQTVSISLSFGTSLW